MMESMDEIVQATDVIVMKSIKDRVVMAVEVVLIADVDF